MTGTVEPQAPPQRPFAAFVGLESGPISATDSIDPSAVRRFLHAVMDGNPRYLGPGGRPVGVPLLYPVNAFRRALDAPDPLAAAETDPEFDGVGSSEVGLLWGLPVIPETVGRRLLNGGNHIRFHGEAEVGDELVVRARYADVYEKTSSSGRTMLFVVVESSFTTGSGRPLLTNRQNLIYR